MPERLKILLVFVLVEIFIGTYVFAQLSFKTYTIEDGLSQNSVYTITQTKDRLLWLGTHDGLNSFDGKNFVTYIPETADNKKRSAIIQALHTINDHYLLVGTNSELLVFDLKYQKFYPASQIFRGLNLPEMVSPRKFIVVKDVIWILTLAHGIYQYNIVSKKLQNFFQSSNKSDKLTDIAIDEKHRIWLASETNVHLFKHDKFEKIAFSNVDVHSFGSIRSILMKTEEILIAFSNNGLLKFNLNTKTNHLEQKNDHSISSQKDITRLLTTTNGEVYVGSRSHGIIVLNTQFAFQSLDFAGYSKMSLRKNYVLSIFEDVSNQVWVGLSGGGLAKMEMNDNSFGLVRLPANKNNSDNMIFCIDTDDDNTLYLGTLTSGLVEYNLKSKTVKYLFDQRLPIETRNIYDIEIEGEVIWLATWAGLCSFNRRTKIFTYYKDKNFYKATKLYSLNIIKQKGIMLVGGEFGLSCFDLKSKKWLPCFDKQDYLGSHIVVARYMENISSTEIGLSTLDRNFIKYNYVTGVFTEYPQFQALSLSSRHFFLDDNMIWLATDNGLIQADRKTFQVIKLWTRKHGLSHDFVYAVQKDDNMDIWVSHNKGISKLNPSYAKLTNFGMKDGLQDLEFNSASCYKTKNGSLIFGGINGLNIVDLLKLKKTNNAVMPILTDVRILNQNLAHPLSVNYIDTLQLKYTENWISLDYIAPNVLNDDKLNYKYRLFGNDLNWVDAGQRTFVNYNNLKPGSYNFELKSYDRNGNESKVNNQLHIIIQKPLWREPWFIGLVGLSISGLGLYLVYSRVNSIRRRHEVQLKMVELETKAIQLQMNSHFIFNCLNNISQMILSNDTRNATTFLNKFASVLREKMNQSKIPFVSLAHEIDYIFNYLALEEIRIDNLKMTLQIEDGVNTNGVEVPTNILQPLVEKIIWFSSDGSIGKTLNLIVSRWSNNIECSLSFENDDKLESFIFNDSFGDNISSIETRLRLINEKYNKRFEIKFVNNSYIRFRIPSSKN